MGQHLVSTRGGMSYTINVIIGVHYVRPFSLAPCFQDKDETPTKWYISCGIKYARVACWVLFGSISIRPMLRDSTRKSIHS